MIRRALHRAYSKPELLAVDAGELLEDFPGWSKRLAFDAEWVVWARFQQLDLLRLCDAHKAGRRRDELLLVDGKMRGLGEEARYVWRNLVRRSIGFRVAGVDRVVLWRDKPFTWGSDEFWQRLEAEERAPA